MEQTEQVRSCRGEARAGVKFSLLLCSWADFQFALPSVAFIHVHIQCNEARYLSFRELVSDLRGPLSDERAHLWHNMAHPRRKLFSFLSLGPFGRLRPLQDREG